jgi:hypothetical protein
MTPPTSARSIAYSAAALAALLAATAAQALKPGERVDNFRLFDHLGGSHELYYLSA